MELYACPNCTLTDHWIAHYYEPTTQTCDIRQDDDGDPGEVDYTGGTRSYDAGADYKYECRECGYEIHVSVDPESLDTSKLAELASLARTALGDPAAYPVDSIPAGQLLSSGPLIGVAIDHLDAIINALRTPDEG